MKFLSGSEVSLITFGGQRTRFAGRFRPVFGVKKLARLGVVLVICGAIAPSGAVAQSSQLDELRDEVGELTQRFAELDADLHEIEDDIAANELRLEEAQAQVDLHKTSVIQTAVVGFTRSYKTPVVLRSEDLAEGVRAEGLSDAAVGKDDDAINRFRAAHHSNRAGVELSRDPRLAFVFSPGNHANAWNQNNRGIGVAHRG